MNNFVTKSSRMGCTLSDPNKGQIRIDFRESQMRLTVLSTLLHERRQRLDPKMWNHNTIISKL